MIIAIFGDIHSNFDAFTEVLKDAKAFNVKRYYCVGDVVGYAAEPSICIDTLIDLNCITSAGNHDFGVVGKISIDNFNSDAYNAILWTRDSIMESDKEFLKNLPMVIEEDTFTIVHGTLNSPGDFHYLLSDRIAALTFKLLKTKVCFVGHTHVPVGFLLKGNKISHTLDAEIDLKQYDKVIINTGSVGQPRDRDDRASYILYDTDMQKLYFRRVPYDIESAAEKIYKAGLPKRNGDRLSC